MHTNRPTLTIDTNPEVSINRNRNRNLNISKGHVRRNFCRPTWRS